MQGLSSKGALAPLLSLDLTELRNQTVAIRVSSAEAAVARVKVEGEAASSVADRGAGLCMSARSGELGGEWALLNGGELLGGSALPPVGRPGFQSQGTFSLGMLALDLLPGEAQLIILGVAFSKQGEERIRGNVTLLGTDPSITVELLDRSVAACLSSFGDYEGGSGVKAPFVDRREGLTFGPVDLGEGWAWCVGRTDGRVEITAIDASGTRTHAHEGSLAAPRGYSDVFRATGDVRLGVAVDGHESWGACSLYGAPPAARGSWPGVREKHEEG